MQIVTTWLVTTEGTRVLFPHQPDKTFFLTNYYHKLSTPFRKNIIRHKHYYFYQYNIYF